MTTYLDQETIKEDIEETPEPTDEGREIDPQDEGDDAADTTPLEAEELADEGEEIFKEERKRHQTHDPFQE